MYNYLTSSYLHSPLRLYYSGSHSLTNTSMLCHLWLCWTVCYLPLNGFDLQFRSSPLQLS